jgi:hypothetical protein
VRTTLSRLAAVTVIFAVGCGQPAFERLAEARRLTAELLVQFNKASDATDRVVMAAAEDASASFAEQAEQAHAAVEQHSEALRSVLATLRLTDESERLDTFVLCYDESRALDLRIRTLALESTNVKAQQLAFGPAHEAATAFQAALSRTTPANAGWQARAVALTAVAAVRDIQVLQARHIPEDEEAVMTELEQAMRDAEKVARESLGSLAHLPAPVSQGDLRIANEALDRFVSLNTEILGLSRRNSNVHSLALSLGEKGKLASKCEGELRALQAELAKRGFSGTR